MGLVASDSFATQYGSFINPSVVGDIGLSDGDELVGFTVFSGVYTVTDAGTIEWEGYHPLQGTVHFDGGRLRLNTDLTMSSDAYFVSGLILRGVGGAYDVVLPDIVDEFQFPADYFRINDIKMVFNSDVLFDEAEYNFRNDSVIEGNDNILTCSLSTITINVGATLHIKNLTIKGIDVGTFVGNSDTSSLVLENVTWIQDDDFAWETGSIDIYGTIKMRGSSVFTYASTQLFTIHSNAELFFDSGMTFSYAASSVDRLIFQDFSSRLHLYETQLYSSVPSLNLTKGELVVEGVCPVFSEAITEADGIKLGDGIDSVNNIRYSPLAESGLVLQSGYVVYDNV